MSAKPRLNEDSREQPHLHFHGLHDSLPGYPGLIEKALGCEFAGLAPVPATPLTKKRERPRC